MAGCRITPVLIFWTLRDLHWVEFTFETGFELPSSCLTLPAYTSNLNRNILDFMRWPQIWPLRSGFLVALLDRLCVCSLNLQVLQGEANKARAKGGGNSTGDMRAAPVISPRDDTTTKYTKKKFETRKQSTRGR
jgi:hypothetical protein